MNKIRSPIGMKIPANLFHVRLVVGEGYQTLPNIQGGRNKCQHALIIMRNSKS
jgi:hypothetical protein